MLHGARTLHKPPSPAWPGRSSTAKLSRAIRTREGAWLFKPKDSADARTDEDKLTMNKLSQEEGRMELWASRGAEDAENGSWVIFPTSTRRRQDAAPGLYNPQSP